MLLPIFLEYERRERSSFLTIIGVIEFLPRISLTGASLASSTTINSKELKSELQIDSTHLFKSSCLFLVVIITLTRGTSIDNN